MHIGTQRVMWPPVLSSSCIEFNFAPMCKSVFNVSKGTENKTCSAVIYIVGWFTFMMLLLDGRI